MRDVMRGGELFGKVALDTLTAPGTYGLGPLAYLRGEVVLWDGVPYVGRVDPADDSAMLVAVEDTATAPFLVYAHVAAWREVSLPPSVRDLPALERFLRQLLVGGGDSLSQNMAPAAFRLGGTFAEATVHLQNLPPGSTVSSPAEAHRGQRRYTYTNLEADVIGFFSTEHHGVFTHHGTDQHLHLLAGDRGALGHVDALTLEAGAVQLWLPGAMANITPLRAE